MRAALRQRGFSLMEVLVALAVLAIAMAALVKSAGGFTANQAYIENKTLAHWVALNQMAALRTTTDRLPAGTTEGQEEMAGRTWNWQAELTTTADEDVMRATVSVRRDESENVYSQLTGYVEVPRQ